ncbi:hypothetical protein AALA90_07500 [Lachnospiraceae bacterium 38-10]
MKERDERKEAVNEKGTGKGASEKEDLKEQDFKRKLQEMNLLDDFLFGTVVTYPEIGERFVKSLLKTVFGREFRHLSVTAQKVFYGADSDLHGARLDVYMEPEIEEDSERRATVYDMEPDRKGDRANIKALPRRMRFYHAKIAARSLDVGADYDKLKNVVIIMIMPYDPFGLKRMVYTIENRCVEVPEMPYEDGASTLFLYTRGTEGEPDRALGELLRYMENSTYENAVNKELHEIHRMVETVKRDPEVSAKYMLRHLRYMEELNKIKAEGLAEGKMKERISLVSKKLKRGKTLEQIAEELEEEVSAVEPIYNAAKKFAPEYDPEAVYKQINADNR